LKKFRRNFCRSTLTQIINDFLPNLGHNDKQY
jgi:hypothetical protein